MALTVALAGDTMLGRGVAEHLAQRRGPVVAPEVAEVAAEAKAIETRDEELSALRLGGDGPIRPSPSSSGRLLSRPRCSPSWASIA